MSIQASYLQNPTIMGFLFLIASPHHAWNFLSADTSSFCINTRCTWAGGTFFGCAVVVPVFLFWREIVFGVTYILRVDTIQLCGCVSFLVVAGNSSQNENTF
jgi:hypothetical protein